MSRFDQAARRWDEDPAKRERAQAVADAIRRRLPPCDDLQALEYGAGTGLLGLALADAFARLTLADASAEMLAVAQEKIRARGLAHVSTAQLDWAAGGPRPAARWDILFSLMTLHHIPDTAAILRAWRAALRPGGWLFLCDLDAEDGSFHTYDFHGHHGFERQALAATVTAAGFAVTAWETPYIIQREKRRYPLFLLAARRTEKE